jgi:hypothetical protein
VAAIPARSVIVDGEAVYCDDAGVSVFDMSRACPRDEIAPSGQISAAGEVAAAGQVTAPGEVTPSSQVTAPDQSVICDQRQQDFLKPSASDLDAKRIISLIIGPHKRVSSKKLGSVIHPSIRDTPRSGGRGCATDTGRGTYTTWQWRAWSVNYKNLRTWQLVIVSLVAEAINARQLCAGSKK